MASVNVDAMVRHIDRALRSRNLATIAKHRSALDRALEELQRNEASALKRCERAERHNKKRACKHHQNIMEQRKEVQLRVKYVGLKSRLV